MTYVIAIILAASSVGLGFRLKRIFPKLHIVMRALVSFLALLMLCAVIVEVSQSFGP
jgi:hypothetical protein